ncbi:pyocin knob domain-containing protein [Bacillus nakamurai]|uniref:pyocin knob domain-containing protein n=1 Tax=Bacillus nakamurai TaxID=1793963 RepID=UPI001E2B5DD5|nr:pyocin knob domain-containing protein [Bacillus nakamurai]MCC9023711.1 pyocin knob domain-containing protein [Bacillus nakamurai]
MAYEEKTDWLPDDPINEDDVNRWEKGIKDAHTDLAAHKNDMNNPHKTTKAQVGLGNVDNVQQAAKKDFDQHVQDQDRHLTKDERAVWNGAQLSKITKDDGAVLINISQGIDFHSVAIGQKKTFTFYTASSGINTPPKSTRGIYLYSSPTYGEAIALANDGGLWRKSLVGGTWSDWVKYETEEGSIKRVSAHADDKDVHVTKSDKDKWNAGQLFKLTEDNGKVFYKSSSETTDYNTLNTTGMYLIYNSGLNSPGLTQCFLLVMSSGNTLIQTAYDATNGLKSFYRIRKYDSATWTSWVEMETTGGAQLKVNAHANNTDIHVTKSDKDKWNNAQLYKLTDTQGCRTKIPDGTDLLTLPSGLYFAVGNVITNNPVSGDASWYNYDVIETGGGGGRKTILASRSYDGIFWMATIHTDGVFKGWNKIETETESQKKADKALTDAKTFVQGNYSNDKLTILTGSNAITDARIGGDEYPKGITIMDIGQGNTTGYPLTYGIVKNEKYSDYRFAQYFYGTGNESGTYFNSTGAWLRHWWSGSGWTKWEKISGFAHANIGTSGIQYLNSTEHTKIKFNRKIKDSHSAFDTNNNRFVAPNDGMYLVGAGLYMINYPSYINFLVKVYLNGTHYKTLDHLRGYFNNSTTEMYVSLNGNATVPMNKGDYLEIWCYCNYGGDESLKRGVADQKGMFNFFDIQEIGGLNYPRVD